MPHVSVVEVVDGDTIRVRFASAVVEPVRLIGINAPERGECLSLAAQAKLAELVEGRELRLEADASERDRYGRLLRYVYADGVLVNEALVEAGLALARRYEPDTRLAERLEAAQAQAQAAGRGQWAPDACGPAADTGIEIVEVVADAPGDDSQNLNGEWVTIRNAGSDAVELTDWSVKDTSATHRYRFPRGFALAAGGTVRLFSGCGSPTEDALYWCNTGSAIWNNDGDTAFVLDPSGNVVDSWSY